MSDYVTHGLFDRLGTLWRDLLPQKSDDPLVEISVNLPERSLPLVRRQMQTCLDRVGGDVSARERAATLGRFYLRLDDEGRKTFLRLMIQEFCCDDTLIDALLASLREGMDGEARRKMLEELRLALEPPYLTLLKQFNALPEGVKFLVDMRSDVMRFARGDPEMEALNGSMKRLLAHWFDVGFLELRRLTWESPAHILEKIFTYEAVHAVNSWSDLKNRLDSDRRLYAFFHPRMPTEPLIFVQVALLRGLAGNIQELLDVEAPVGNPLHADAAVFYSISNAQRGLTGISFGSFLIKRVVETLLADFPNLKTFATLSPLPGFSSWLEACFAAETPKEASGEGEAILDRIAKKLGWRSEKMRVDLKDMLHRPDWFHDETLSAAMKEPLMGLAARYLVQEKKKGAGVPQAYDPVAHFHLSNGARIERLNWKADLSPKGIAQSAGIMVNYRYKLDEIDRNHEIYRSTGTVALSNSAALLAKDSR